MAKPAPTWACPRCGYDLSGAVDSWSEQCPVEGVCSECGLRFGWRNVLNPDFSRVPRFCEGTARLRWRDLRVTAFKAVRPWIFWRWVQMSHPITGVRGLLAAILSVVLLLPLSVLVFAIAVAAGWAGSVAYFKHMASTRAPVSFTAWFQQGTGDLASLRTGCFIVGCALLGLVLCASLAPLVLIVLSDSLKRAKVRRVHLVRLAVYSLAGAGWVLIPCVAFLGLLPGLSLCDSVHYHAQVNAGLGDTFYFVFLNAAATVWAISTVITAGVWLVACWTGFLSAYLGLSHARRDAIVLFILCAIVAVPSSVMLTALGMMSLS